MNATIVRERSSGGVVIPIIRAGGNIPSKGGKYSTVVEFYLTVCLGVVAVVNTLCIANYAQTAWKTLAVNCGPLSVRSETGVHRRKPSDHRKLLLPTKRLPSEVVRSL
jgi:hypothetical protein